MRLLIYSILAALFFASITGSAAGQIPQAPTEIVVLGTVHAATAKYSVQDLVQILQKVKPDVILYEYPATNRGPND